MGSDTSVVSDAPAPDAATVASSALESWSRPALTWLDQVIHHEIRRLRTRYQLSLDEFRGLYVSDDYVDRLLADETTTADPALASMSLPRALDAIDASPLGQLAAVFDLGTTELLAVLIAFAPELDRKYETLYAYLNDDITLKVPTIDLCLRLTGAAPAHFDPDTTLFREGLIEALPTGIGTSWRSSCLRTRAPVRRFISASPPLSEPAGVAPDAMVMRVCARLMKGLGAVVLLGRADDSLTFARGAAGASGRRLLEVSEIPDVIDAPTLIRDAAITARLHEAWVWFAPEALSLDERDRPTSQVRAALRHACQGTVVFFSVPNAAATRACFDDIDHEVVPLPPPSRELRELLWRRALRDNGTRATENDVQAVARLFVLYPEQIHRAAAAAGRQDPDAAVDLTALTFQARNQCRGSFGPLATPVESSHTWSDLVLPGPTMRRLHEFAAAIRHRDRVFDDWSFGRHAGGSSLRALFSGASGTGKTMAAGVVAHELGLELFRIDLSAVVSKYVGETEKNLERVFSSAIGSNAILFFDEADALFGKRSEVKDAHDRYANVEIAYLLQRMEQHDGVLILATNLATNIDEAFSRRIHFEIDFPLPDENRRAHLWRLLMGPDAPTSNDIDYDFLARQFAFTGGDIANIVLSAAFLAAHEDTPIAMSQLVRAVGRHRRRQGKLPSATEFKDYLRLVTADGG